MKRPTGADLISRALFAATLALAPACSSGSGGGEGGNGGNGTIDGRSWLGDRRPGRKLRRGKRDGR